MNALINLIQNLDNKILLFIKDNMHGVIMDKVMVFATTLGNNAIVWIVIALIIIINKKYRKVGFMVLAALLLSWILGDGLLKHLFQRVRPCANIPLIDMLIAKPLSYSFPSGHSASSFAAAGILAVYFKKYAVGFYTLAATIAFSRLYLYVHNPSDVITGIALGVLCSKIIIIASRKVNDENKIFGNILHKSKKF